MRRLGACCPMVRQLTLQCIMRCVGKAMMSSTNGAQNATHVYASSSSSGSGVAARRAATLIGHGDGNAEPLTTATPPAPVDGKASLIDCCEALTDAVDAAAQRRGGPTKRLALGVDLRHHFRGLLSRVGDLKNELDLHEENMPTLMMVLACLSNASTLLEEERQVHYRSTTSFLDENLTEDSAACFASPYILHEGTLDAVSAIAAFCIRTAVHKQNRNLQGVYEALHHAIQLEVGDPDTLSLACRHLASGPMARRMSSTELVQTVHLITLCHKRRKVPMPILDHLLAPLHGAKDLTPRDMMVVLSALVRAGKNGLSWETARVLSYRLAPVVRQEAEDDGVASTPANGSSSSTFTNRDIVFGFRVVAMADGCSDVFAAAVIACCSKRCSTLTANELGDVCKFMKRIHTSRSLGHLTRSTCGKETRRLMPQLLTRAGELLGTFSLRDARHVLECITTFKLRHSIVFAQLTPFVSNG